MTTTKASVEIWVMDEDAADREVAHAALWGVDAEKVDTEGGYAVKTTSDGREKWLRRDGMVC